MNILLSRLIILLAMFYSATPQANVISCTDQNGKKRFTDNPALCKNNDIEKINLKTHEDKRASFRYPIRNYDNVDSHYTIYIESSDKAEDIQRQKKAVIKLENALDYIFSQLPQHSRTKLETVDYYIMLGKRSAFGGESSGMRYISKGGVKRYSLHDQRWDNSVVIYSVDNFLYHGKLWTNQPLCHELAHAWHLLNWPPKHSPIFETWMHSRHSSLYLSVKDHKGRTVSPAYASTNQLEYFADLSSMFFVGASYYPFDKTRLKQYDPKGYALIAELWGMGSH
ncbi:MAG: hypothetical protein HRU20_17290 [Pseudomonadales bacterium]|nr:hypothetical protein [Pseudomonadales bacterium]